MMLAITAVETAAADDPFRHVTRDGQTTVCGKQGNPPGTPSRGRCPLCWAHTGGRWLR